MNILFNVMLWVTLLVAAAVAFLLLWEDAQDRRRGQRVCACAFPELPGHHTTHRCDFNKEK